MMYLIQGQTNILIILGLVFGLQISSVSFARKVMPTYAQYVSALEACKLVA